MERKVICYQELCALDEVLTESADDDVIIGYHVCEDNTVIWKVNWSCKGAVNSADALEFAKALTWCAEKADALNRIGYTVDFSKWIRTRSEYDRFKERARELVDSL